MPEPAEPNRPPAENASPNPNGSSPAPARSDSGSRLAPDAGKSDPEFAPQGGAATAGEDSPHRPRDAPRYRGKAKIECRKGAAGSSSNIGQGLLDLSEKGASVIVKEAVEAGRTVELRMYPRGENKAVVILGKVIRCEPAEDGSFCLGVRFEKHLQFSDLRRLS